MPNVVVWDSDGHFFRVYSDDALVLKTPFATMIESPDAVLGRDPSTGLPMWTAPPVPSGGGDNYVLAQKTTPTGTTAQWVPGPEGAAPPEQGVPDPVVDNCPLMRCGAARQLGIKLADQYDAIKMLLDFMLTVPFAKVIPTGAVGRATSAVLTLLVQLIDWCTARGMAGWMINVLNALLGALTFGTLRWNVAPALGPDGPFTLAFLAYPHLTCSDNTFALTPAMVSAWQAAISFDTTDFPDDVGRHLLLWCIQFTPFQTYYLSAQSGANNPSDACAGWPGP